jgi:hypothetical protein
MLESQREQEDRRRTMQNDARVREQIERVFAQDQSVPRQASTFHQHAQADADTPLGRFSAVSAAYVVGSTATPQYPQASTPFQHDPVPDEPPLSFDNPALEVSSLASCSPQATPNPASDVPSTPLGGDAGLGLSPDLAAQPMSQMSSAGHHAADVRAERSPAYRRY